MLQEYSIWVQLSCFDNYVVYVEEIRTYNFNIDNINDKLRNTRFSITE